MNREEAARILGVLPGETPQEIRRRYHRLLHRYHPDAAGAEDEESLEYSRKVIEAFRFLKREGMQHSGRVGNAWGVLENRNAFCARNIYMEDDLFGDSIILSTGARGRYYWDPDLESFRMFLRSLGEAVRSCMEEVSDMLSPMAEAPPEETALLYKAKLLHLLIQEFVDPYQCLDQMYPYIRKLSGKSGRYEVRCHLMAERDVLKRMEESADREGWTVHPGNNRLAVSSPEGEKGQITFEETSLNYIIIPLFLQKAAGCELRTLPGTGSDARGRTAPYRNAVMTLDVDKSRKKDVTEEINREIKETLRKYAETFEL